MAGSAFSTRGLIGRDEELRTFDAILDAGVDRGSAVLVVGDPGIGKSVLLDAVRGAAHDRRSLVLTTAGVESETRMPYGGLTELLGSLLDDGGSERMRAEYLQGLPPHQRLALDVALGRGDGPPPTPFLVALAVLGLLTATAATDPVVLLVDDAHWLDRPSHDALAFVARRLRMDPIVLVATMRRVVSSAAPDPMLPLAEACEQIDLPALDEVAARRVLDTVAVGLSTPTRARVLREADGNPLALMELPRAMSAAPAWEGGATSGVLPTTARLEHAFAGRLHDLGAAARDVLLVAAIGSVDDVVEVLRAVSALRDETVGLEPLDEGAAAGLLTADLLRVRFRHPLVRSVVVAGSAPSRARAAHSAWASVLEGEPLRRVWHRAHSLVGTDDEVADQLEAGHRAALARGDVGSAAWALERAGRLSSDLAVRGHRLLLAADLALASGDGAAVERLVGDAEGLPLGDLARARVSRLRASLRGGTDGDSDGALEMCEVARRATRAGDHDLAGDILQLAAVHCWWTDAPPRVRDGVVGTIHSLDDRGGPRRLMALGCADPIACGPEVMAHLADVRIESVRDGEELRGYGLAADTVGDEVRAADFLERAETALRDEGRLALLQMALAIQLSVQLELGDWPRAREAADEVQRLAAETGQGPWRGAALVGPARLAAMAGDTERALDLVDRAEHAVAGHRLPMVTAALELARGTAWLVAGQPAGAFTVLRRLFDPADVAFHRRERLDALLPLADAAVACGRVEEARAIAADVDGLRAVTPSPLLRVQLLVARAVLDDPESAVAADPATAADLARWPWPRARLDLARGQWLRRQRRGAEAREALHAALTTLQLIGAEPWATVARRELRAAGEPMDDPGRAVRAADLLSAQEMQIARLAATGLTNREVGARLFLSPRTVSSYLYRIFPKLGVTSRSQLLHRLGTTSE